MIIDPTDFNDRPYKVPNQEESRDFSSFLSAYEDRIAVEHLLGVDLWTAFQEGLTTSGTIDPIWLALKNGTNYQYNNKTYRFLGWVDMIRPAIYAHWQPEGTWKFTNSGWVENNANSAPQAGNQSKLLDDQYVFHVKSWNDFVVKVGSQIFCGYNYINSFYGFMKANESNYENWIFNAPQPKNRFDI